MNGRLAIGLFSRDLEKNIYESAQSELVAVYGSRRVRNIVIASCGLDKSDYWGVFSSVITPDGLFRF